MSSYTRRTKNPRTGEFEEEPNQDTKQPGCFACNHTIMYAELPNSGDVLAYCPNQQCPRYGLFTLEEGEL
jgi:hypothetical protein